MERTKKKHDLHYFLRAFLGVFLKFNQTPDDDVTSWAEGRTGGRVDGMVIGRASRRVGERADGLVVYGFNLSVSLYQRGYITWSVAGGRY